MSRPGRPPQTTLDPCQIAALDLMLAGATETAIAAQLKVDRKTLYRWRTHNPAFRQALADYRATTLNLTANRLRALLDASLNTLEKQVQDPWIPTSHRAARTLLSLGQRAAKHPLA